MQVMRLAQAMLPPLALAMRSAQASLSAEAVQYTQVMWPMHAMLSVQRNSAGADHPCSRGWWSPTLVSSALDSARRGRARAEDEIVEFIVRWYAARPWVQSREEQIAQTTLAALRTLLEG